MKLWLSLLLLSAAPAHAACRSETFAGASYTICEAEKGDDVRLFLNDASGEKYASFDRVNKAVGGKLVFAMNAGMYHPDRRPVGLYVEDGEALTKLITKDTSGNFGLLPNGVFCIAEDGFAVIESRAFKANQPNCRYASQSGPMLVIDGALHPKFLEGSSYTNTRNGVGVSDDGSRAVFVISDQAVNFWDFASFMRDGLGLNNALYFDGTISRLYAPEIGRDDIGFAMGPIVGLVGE
jgi:uncharacterized protein YigE (DUF2233 family)